MLLVIVSGESIRTTKSNITSHISIKKDNINLSYIVFFCYFFFLRYTLTMEKLNTADKLLPKNSEKNQELIYKNEKNENFEKLENIEKKKTKKL